VDNVDFSEGDKTKPENAGKSRSDVARFLENATEE
jgi:hypothetical protein